MVEKCNMFINSFYSLTTAQETLINSNLMAISKKKNIIPEFIAKNIEKLSLFKSQKLQILANAHNFGFELEKSQLKSVTNPNSFSEITATSSPSIYDFNSLKADTKSSVKKKCKKEPTRLLDKERWMPLRDRSYYKTKAQYLKTLKTSKVNKK